MLEVFETPVTVLHIIACLMLVLIVLIQPGKSGGISAALGGAGAQQVFGGRGAGNFLTRGTWILATTFFLTSVFLAYVSSSVEDTLDERTSSAKKSETPAAPAEQKAPEAPAAPAAPPPVQPAAPAGEPAPPAEQGTPPAAPVVPAAAQQPAAPAEPELAPQPNNKPAEVPPTAPATE